MKKFDQINVIPFIDIMLVLLAIVLMTASFISQGKIKVDVPEAQTATSLGADDISRLITITADGRYYLNDQETNLDMLADNMELWSDEQAVTLKIDAQTAFNEFIQVSDLLRKYSLKNVQVVTLPKAE
ncbi:TonB system transport protein ExbD [Suttonella sp. R2A3]|uniref:TonB system transport protein ExbD n=1 Tax=Suttonella sp. R2A3 TaxID=2908648 RepID=UPI001F46BA9A|nr:TonB system transport protein ExbD [Suttonella sp. R2A3]UJF25077.1 TonB system transport protein ExbD [Suttonella sp. R2A3]